MLRNKRWLILLFFVFLVIFHDSFFLIWDIYFDRDEFEPYEGKSRTSLQNHLKVSDLELDFCGIGKCDEIKSHIAETNDVEKFEYYYFYKTKQYSWFYIGSVSILVTVAVDSATGDVYKVMKSKEINTL